jgi:hypothetical protein
MHKKFTGIPLSVLLLAGAAVVLVNCQGAGKATPPSFNPASSGGRVSIPYVPTVVKTYVPNPTLTVFSIHVVPW